MVDPGEQFTGCSGSIQRARELQVCNLSGHLTFPAMNIWTGLSGLLAYSHDIPFHETGFQTTICSIIKDIYWQKHYQGSKLHVQK